MIRTNTKGWLIRLVCATGVLAGVAYLMGAFSDKALAQTSPPPPLTVQFACNSHVVVESAGYATIEVTLSASSSDTVTVYYFSTDGTATAGSDYTAVSGYVVFPPGSVSQTFQVPILPDTIVEDPETVILTLSSPQYASLGDPSVSILWIVDDTTCCACQGP
jgi:hypothetical protein